MNPCIICGRDGRVRRLEQAGEYAILFCDACRLRFSHPMAHPGQGFYEDSGLYENRDMANVSLSLPRLEWRYPAFLRRAAAARGQSLLDVGCGDGGFLDLARSLGLKTYGLEIDSRGVAIARQVRGLEHVERGRLEDIGSLGWKDFDLVTCMEVMEHVADPLQLAGSLRDLLRPGGLVGISVPSWDRRPAWFGRETDYPPHHFTLWTREALHALLEKAGFTEIVVLESPVKLQIFVYALLGWLRALRPGPRAGDTGTPAPGGSPAGKAGGGHPAPVAEEGRIPHVNRKRVALKWAVYSALNLANPLLARLPFLRGFTLLAVGRRPAA